jgi:tetratricopeptide (TPR) repeat protein
MKWSLMVGKFWGTEIRLHASLLLLIPYTLLVFKPADLPGALRVLFLITAIFAFVALHELGHTLAARLYGIEVTSIVLWPLGGFANLSRRPEKVLPDMVISVSGPLANLLIFVALASLTIIEYLLERTQLFPALARFLWQWDVFPFLLSLSIANLSLALFNLVPVYPLDGGQIARGLLKLAFGEKNADRVMLFFSLPLALALTLAGVFARDVVIILTGLVLLLASATLDPRLLNGLMLAWLYFIDRAGYYLKRSDFDPAVREYSRAIERSPNRAGLYLSRAVAHMNLMECEQAKADVACALERDASNPVAWALHGELLSLEKNDEAAMAAYNRAIELRPGWSIAYLDRGGRYQERGDLPCALADMDKAVELGHGSPVNFLLRCLLRYEMGNLEGYRADADRALRFAPQWMLAFPELFLTNVEGHLNWAMDYYGRAIEHMPNAYQAYQGRGDACRANGRPDWAIEDYHRAIHLAQGQAELYLSRGRAYQQTGMLDKAAADFKQAAALADKAHIRRQASASLNVLFSQTAPTAAPTPATEQSSPAV